MTMALPGLDFDASSVQLQEEKSTVVHQLAAGTEWRFEVAFDHTIEVKLLEGTAEIFGTELAQNQNEPYVFQGRKVAIFTWRGCRIEVTGNCQSDYKAEETPMISYANTHFALEALRDDAAESYGLGPRVLVVGPENAGKTSLVKLLAGYAIRSERTPVIVNLDPKEGMLTVPGTLSAAALESIIDVSEGWGSSPISGPSQIPVKLPLVYYYGLEDPDTMSDLFKPLVRRLALSVINRLQDDSEAGQTGCIIDTTGSMSQGKGNYDIVQYVVAEFQVNVIIVLGSERLYNDMSRRFSRQAAPGVEGITVVKLEKSGGCVDRDSDYLQKLRENQMKEYFFGSSRSQLSPYSQQLAFDDIMIYRPAEDSDVFNALLPGGDEVASAKKDIYEKIEPGPMMQNALLAIIQAEPSDSQESIRDSSVIGYVYVSEIDEKRRKIKVLAPMSGRIPRRVLVWGLWPESAGNLLG